MHDTSPPSVGDQRGSLSLRHCTNTAIANPGIDSTGGGLLCLGPYTSRLSCSLIGSNVRAIVSRCLARKYIYGREICLLSLGPPSLESRRSALVTRMYDSRIAAAPT